MSEYDVKTAESKVKQDAQNLKQAVGHLEERIDGVVHTVNRPREALNETVKRSREIALGIAKQGRERSQLMVQRVRANPVPFILGLTAFIGGALLAAYVRNRRNLAYGQEYDTPVAEGHVQWTTETAIL